MVLEFTRNIRIIDDHLLFNAVVSCTVNLSKDNYKGYYSYETSQWLVVSCEVTISHKLESLDITSIKSYSGRSVKRNYRQAVSGNIVPVIYKKDLDAEATIFLEKYYPEALTTPMPVPIDDIAKVMGLEVI